MLYGRSGARAARPPMVDATLDLAVDSQARRESLRYSLSRAAIYAFLTLFALIYLLPLFGALNGYVLSKWRFPGSETLFVCIVLGVFMPGQIALLPWAYILGAV